MKVLVFDTETTGLPQSYNAELTDFAKWPHIVQLSFLLYDTEAKVVLEYIDSIIRVGPEVIISPESIAIHQITPARSQTEGVPIVEALAVFEKTLIEADLIVGHNISFDKKMLMVELLRHQLPNFFYFAKGTSSTNSSRREQYAEYCTMKQMTELCALPAVNKNTGKTYCKYPTLTELHEHLFKSKPNGVHNAMIDVLVCLRCYIYHVYKYDIASHPAVQETLRGLYKSYCLN
jgi:DNA polymerase-3 subunit epsilon